MFSQSEAIYGRSIFPIQDTPAVKFTYTGEVKVPEGYSSYMSAYVTEKTSTVTKFDMPHPVPSYLVSVCIGHLKEKSTGPRTSVIAEPSQLKKCSDEFEELEKYLKIAEDILFEYPLKHYSVIVLPASFAYGGMENPITTFVTPTIVTGDKSCVDVVCHEIAHSWTGNLVTNTSWEDFWLNEGFT